MFFLPPKYTSNGLNVLVLLLFFSNPRKESYPAQHVRAYQIDGKSANTTWSGCRTTQVTFRGGGFVHNVAFALINTFWAVLRLDKSSEVSPSLLIRLCRHIVTFVLDFQCHPDQQVWIIPNCSRVRGFRESCTHSLVDPSHRTCLVVSFLWFHRASQNEENVSVCLW